MISDCCSLVQHLEFTTVIGSSKVLEKRLTMDLQSIRQEAEEKVYLREVMWTQTTVQLADCMTKYMPAKQLYQAMETNVIKLTDKESKKQYTPSAKQTELRSKIEALEAYLGQEVVDEFFNQEYEENELVKGIGRSSQSTKENYFKRKYYQY